MPLAKLKSIIEKIKQLQLFLVFWQTCFHSQNYVISVFRILAKLGWRRLNDPTDELESFLH